MENNFSFEGNKVEVKDSGNGLTNYAQPGIHEFQMISMELKATPNGSQYMDCQVVNTIGEVASRQYYLTTNRNTPSGKSAFDISSESLKKLSVATGKTEAYDSATANSPEEFVHKMSAIFIGTKFRNKLKGKQIRKADGNTFIKGEMSDAFESISIPSTASRLKFNSTTDIKYIDGNSTQMAPSTVNATGDSSDLPF